MMRGLAFACVVALLARCGSIPARCEYGAFSIGSSHMTNPIAEPFVLRELRGRLVPVHSPSDPGAWMGPSEVRLQVNGPNGFSMNVPLAPDGTFHVPNLPPGRYCFRTSSDYWQGYEGTIVIRPRATATTMTIELAHGA